MESAEVMRTLFLPLALATLCTPLASNAEATLTFARTPDCYVSTTGRITTTAFTVELWFNQTAFDAENQLFHQDIGGDNGRLILTTINGTNRFHIGNNILNAKTRVTADVWTHVAYVRSSSGQGYIYLNGSLDNSGTLNTVNLAANNIIIGRLARANYGFRGQISDVRVWNVARTQPEIQANLLQRLTGSEPNLIHYWPLNDGSGSVASNLASNARGTISGATWTTSTDLPVSSAGAYGAWASSAGGTWSTAANWLNLSPVSNVNSVAYFTNLPPASIAVDNDITGLQLGGLTVNGPSSHTFTGNMITFINSYQAPSRITTTNGAHTFECPLASTAQGTILDARYPGALTLSDTLSGAGTVSVNSGASGGGIVTLTGANSYTGPTVLSCGTLRASALANGDVSSSLGAASASASNLLLGPGTLHVTGAATSTDRGYTLQAGSGRASILRTDSDVTIGGQALATSGALIKTGPGTLSYTYPGVNTLTVYESGNLNTLINTGANGDSPTTGFSGLSVLNGKLVLGVPGQTNICNQRIDIGLTSTAAAGAETAGELEINDGALLCNITLSIGRGNGNTNTAPGGLSSRLTVNGGTVTCGLLALGFAGGAGSGYNARPACDINGGTFTMSGCSIGESTGSYAVVSVRGGTLRVTGTGGTSISVGGAQTVAGTGVLNLSGDGVIDVPNDISVAATGSAYGTLNLDGGTLYARNIVKGSGLSAFLNFNGCRFLPRTQGRTLSGLTAATVSTNGALIDTSLASYTVSQNLLHSALLGSDPDGGLVKFGTNTLTISSYGSTYTGPTVVSNGTLCVAGALPAGNAVTVGTDGELLVGGSATQTVAAASLTLDGSAKLGFAFALDGSANDRLTVSSSPSLGTGRITLYQLNTRLPFTKNGTYTLMMYSGADPATAGLTCGNAAYGKTYSFAASGGSLTVTIATDTGSASVWNVNASGSWGTGSNWSVAPASAAGSQVRFDSAITSPAAVTTAGETVGEIFFNNLNAYTLAGSGLTIDNNTAPALINVESGVHTISAPLTLSDDTTLNLSASTLLTLGQASGASATLTAQGNGTLALTGVPDVQSLTLNVSEVGISNTMALPSPVTLLRAVTVRPALGTTATVNNVVSGAASLTKAGSSTLALSAANTYTGPTTVSAGTLSANTLANGGAASSVGASPAAAANLVLGPATFRYTGPAATVNRGYNLSAGSGKAAVLRAEGDITFGGQVTSTSGSIIKNGPGTVRYTYANGVNTMNSGEGATDAVQNIGPNGDSPTAGFSGYTVTDGKVILGANGQTNTFNGRLTVGLCTTTAAGAETAGELEIIGGVVNCTGANGTVSVGRGNGSTTTAPGGLTSRLTVNGGTVNFNLLALGYRGVIADGQFNARPVVDVNAGTVNVAAYTQIAESRGAIATLNVRGGTLRCNGQNGGGGLTLGGPQNPSGTGTLNLSGTGVVEVVHNVLLGTYAGGTGTVHLIGGALIASNIVKGAGIGFVRFNGGTFFPRAPGRTLSGLTAAHVSTNGALIDTSLADGYTVAQNLLTDPGLGGATDGGLVKLGTNTLSLTGTGSTFNGLIDVRNGLLRARVGGTNDLTVATNAVFDALGFRATVGDLLGCGTLTNGVIAVAGTLDAGTNSAPAGAWMTVENLSLAGGSTFACDWSTNALGQVTNDFVTVTGTLASEGPGFVDFGRSEADPIRMPFRTSIMSYGTFTGSFAGWKAVNTGLPSGSNIALTVTANGGLVKITVKYCGTLLMVR